jgi:1,4-dihydroxy-2-naphthoyl-CoA synthase
MKWNTVKEYDDITYKKKEGIARIAFNRPEFEMLSGQKHCLNYRKH